MADDHGGATTEARLFERDFYLWSQDQAQAIRAAAARGELPAGLDWENPAEEVGDFGKSELNAAINLTTNIIEHLYLLAGSRNDEPRNRWRKEIRAFHLSLRRRLTPSVRRLVKAELEALHAEIAIDVEAHFSGRRTNSGPNEHGVAVDDGADFGRSEQSVEVRRRSLAALRPLSRPACRSASIPQRSPAAPKAACC